MSSMVVFLVNFRNTDPTKVDQVVHCMPGNFVPPDFMQPLQEAILAVRYNFNDEKFRLLKAKAVSPSYKHMLISFVKDRLGYDITVDDDDCGKFTNPDDKTFFILKYQGPLSGKTNS